MALIDRVSRLLKADFHAVLDRLEEPEQLLKQAIRDMEDELAAGEHRIAVCELDQTALSGRRNELQDALSEIEAQLDLCFESGKDELARKLVRKKLEAKRLSQRLRAKQEANQALIDEQRASLEENSATLQSLRQKAELFAHRPPPRPDTPSRFDDIAWMARDMGIGEDEVEIEYLREKGSRSAS